MSSSGDLEDLMSLLSDVYTCILFFAACSIVWVLGFSYIIVQLIRDSWINFLEKRFPELEFVREETIRSAVDSHRNIGVIVALVVLKGRCDLAYVKERLQTDLAEKRLPDGSLAFRHIRMTLTSRWGKYAWYNSPFCIDNHISVGWAHYRGRSINEANVQECVCEVVSRYLPPEIPPWHLTIIPTSSDRSYLVLRVHHLLLTSSSNLNLGDFLPFTMDAPEPRELRPLSTRSPWSPYHRAHPFQDLYKPPQALPALLDQLSEAFSNQWNEFLAVFDPVENPSALKRPSVRATLAVLFIASVATLKNTLKSWTLSSAEFQRRITRGQIIRTVWGTLGPLVLITRLFHFSLQAAQLFFFRLPLLFACEFWALCMINNEEYSDRSMIKTLLDGWRSVQASLREILYFCRLCYGGPRILVDEVLSARGPTARFLRTVSTTGRKVVSWSEPMPVEILDAIEEATGASSCDVILAAVAASLRDFFTVQGRTVPAVLLATAQAVPQEVLLGNGRSASARRTLGAVSLAIPTKNPWDEEEGPVAELHGMQQVLLQTKLRQPALYLATLIQLEHGFLTKALPRQVVRLLVNAFTRRFAVTVTEVLPELGGRCRNQKLWNQQVETFMYWNPPQANVCLSLTLLQHLGQVRIGVMADSALSPHYSIISSAFPGHIRRLATAAGIKVETRRPRLPSAGSEGSGGIRTPQSLSSSGDEFEFEDEPEDEEDAFGFRFTT